MTDAQVIELAGRAGFGGNQRNTLLVKLIAFANAVEQATERRVADEMPLLWVGGAKQDDLI